MVINALAAQAKSSPTHAVGRFRTTSRHYLGLSQVNHQPCVGESEFVDPPRYRSLDLQPVKRAAI